jgi:hypothetical protein
MKRRELSSVRGGKKKGKAETGNRKGRTLLTLIYTPLE